MTDEERAEFLEKLATSRDVRLDDIATLEEIATRLRARSEDTERLEWLENTSSFSAGTLRLGADPKLLRWLNARDDYTEQPTIRAAIDSARKRGQ